MASLAMNDHLIDRKSTGCLLDQVVFPYFGAQLGVLGIISLKNPQIAPKFVCRALVLKTFGNTACDTRT